jgi:hypothetical protein
MASDYLPPVITIPFTIKVNEPYYQLNPEKDKLKN